MSYSVCIKCKTMVGGYEKYCPACLEKYHIKQDDMFHKMGIQQTEWPAEFKKDRELAKFEKQDYPENNFIKAQQRLWNNMDTLCKKIARGALRPRFPIEILRKILRPETKKEIDSLLR